ncbi:MAG: hypothetical protein SAJ12_11950 [Jaaginema sp. PMC 1079.18]|nr:hypothetical protein [Jaaginema sp. PMC 1080.18]MEC4851719.1 hypothetical protein [Jaaginema sp. PMC 1079.18]MEC4868458.1 hypothetical protein [Jaaginema sp. PMC 1078.18]
MGNQWKALGVMLIGAIAVLMPPTAAQAQTEEANVTTICQNNLHERNRSGSGICRDIIDAGTENAKVLGYYRGQIVNGLRQGYGVYIFAQPAEGDEQTEFRDRYEGYFRNDVFEGQGKLIYRNDDRYEGQFRNGLPHGRGVYLFSPAVDNEQATPGYRHRYEGQFQNGRFQGLGTLRYARCQMYSRERLRCDNYQGPFVNGAPQGQGVFTYSTCLERGGNVVCDTFRGNFYDGQPNGNGSITFANGDRCQGSFNDASLSGRGNCTFVNGRRYQGEYRRGLPHGRGIMTFPDGKVYRGEFQAGQPTGFGVSN